jgi:phytol kinase
MFILISTLAAWSLIILAVELIWRRGKLKGEYARKTVHILLSVSLAFMPLYLSWNMIKIGAVLSLIGVLLLRTTNLIQSVYDVKRSSWGDVVGPAAIAIIAFLEPSKSLFAAVVLHIGLADGLAAVIGTRFGRNNQYTVLGNKKSWAGTTTFIICSFMITLGLILFGPPLGFATLWPLLILLPLATSLVENFGVYGSDNALIALTVTLLWQLWY